MAAIIGDLAAAEEIKALKDLMAALRVTSLDWVSYPILTFPEAPVLEIDLVGSPRDKPLGAGEAASAPVPAAIGNAVFDATGVRMRKVPLTAARVRAALAGQRQT